MRKGIALILALTMLFTFSPAGTAFADAVPDHEHEWKEATFSKPKTCTVCGITEGEPVNGPVYNPFGFCLSPYNFLYIYDRALGTAKHWGDRYGLKMDGEFPEFESTYRIAIGFNHSGSLGEHCAAWLNFEGNDNFLYPMNQVAVEFQTAEYLLSNYTQFRSEILGFYAALVLAVELDVTTIEEAMEISDAAFAAASGGEYIHHVNTRELPNIPAAYRHGDVIYTVDIKNDNLFMTAAIDAVPPLAIGSSGDIVKEVQDRLIALGYLPAGSADGNYLNSTADAVKQFQKDSVLDETGTVDSLTYRWLFR